MVDLPIPNQPVVEAQTPVNRVSGMQYARSGNYLADGLQKLAGGLEDVAVPLADQAARGDVAGGLVTRNADGSIQYNSPASLPIFGAAGEAYNHAVQVGGMAQGQTQVTQDLNAIRLKYQGDPAGQATAMQSYNDNLKTKMGGTPLGDAMVQEAQKQAGQYQIGAMDEKSRLDLAASRTAIDANIADLTAQGTALASTPGGISNPDGTPTQAFVDIQNKLSGYYKNLVANPLFGYPQDKADIDQQHLKSTFMAENLVGNIDQAYSKHDKATAQALLDNGILQNQYLPDAEKNRLYAQGMARLQFLDGDTKAAIAGNDKAVTEIEGKLRDHSLSPDNPAIGFAIQQSKNIRDVAGVQRLNAALLVARGAAPMQGQTDDQRKAALAMPAPGAPSVAAAASATPQGWDGMHYDAASGSMVYDATGAPPAAQPDQGEAKTAALAKNLAAGVSGGLAPSSTAAPGGMDAYKARVSQIENPSGNPNATSSTGATGKYQFIPSTWAKYGNGGDIHGDQEAAMDAYTADSGRQLTSALGRPPTPAELYLAHQQGAGGAKELLANPTARAGDIVGDKAIRVNGGDPNASAATFTNMWAAKFNNTPIPAGGASGSLVSSNGKAFNQADVNANPYLLSAYVASIANDKSERYETAKNLGEGLERAYNGGQIPKAADAAQFVQMSQEPEMKDRLAPLADKIRGAFTANSILAMPNQADRDAHVAQIMNAANGADIHTMNVAAAVKEYVDKGEARMKAAPLSESAQRGIVPQLPYPIEGNPPGALGEIVTQRAKLADRVSAFNGTPTPLLEKRDEPELTTMLQGPGGDQALASLQSVDQATVTKLLSQPSVGEAVAGMAKSGDPVKMSAAYSFIGQQYRNNPMDVERQFGKDTVNQYMAYTKALAFLPADAAMKRVEGWSDPAQAQAREDTRKLADEELKGTTGEQVAAKFSTFSMLHPFTWIGGTAVVPTTGQAATSADGLRASFADAYRDQRELGVDKQTAESSALTLMQSKWGMSGVNGNQVMRNPPEYHYPAIDGSRAWIGEQLDKDMLDATGAGKLITTTGAGAPTTAAQRQAYISAVAAPATFGPLVMPIQGDRNGNIDPASIGAANLYLAPRSLASDSTTEADIAAGKPPSYYVAVKNDRGLWTPMQNKDGSFLRFRPDQNAVPSVAATHAPGFTTGGLRNIQQDYQETMQ